MERRGISLVELLVVLALIGLMGGFVASVYLFGERVILEWERNLRLKNELHTLAEGISEDIYRAEVLEHIGNNVLVLSMPDDTGRAFKMEENHLLRNGRPMNSSDTELVNLVFEWESGGSRPANTSTVDITFIKLRLRITDRRDTLGTSRAVYLRRPLTWKPIGED